MPSLESRTPAAFFAAVFVSLLVLPGSLAALELNGEAVQGGLMFGQAEPGSAVRLDGRDVGATLISEGLAVPYRGGPRIGWCQRLG